MQNQPIIIRVDGEPKGQGRPRAFVRGGHAAVFNPNTADDWKALIAAAAMKVRPVEPIAPPFRVDIDFFFARPGRLKRKRDPKGLLWHTAKPDRDNLDKAVLDILTQIGFLDDDKGACCGRLRKFYCTMNGSEADRQGALITISRLTPEDL